MTLKPENIFIGKKIKEYRMKKKWSQVDLAERLGMKNNTISVYEKGKIAIPHLKLAEIAKVLDAKMTDLLPPEESVSQDSIDAHIREAKAKLSSSELSFLELLIAETNSLEVEQREVFLKNLRFALEFTNKK